MKNKALYMLRALPEQHPWARVRQFLFGTPLRTSSRGKEQLGFFLGLPILAVDALSSVAYATEEILIALSVMGSGYFSLSVPIALTIVMLIAALVSSYSQTVQVYPEAGGAYIVSKNHLNEKASLIAGSSLLIDYILTVAVSVTAGIRALISAFPILLGYNIQLSVMGILILTWINLRGIRESAHLVAIPVYAFIVTILCLGGTGIFKTMVTPYVPDVPYSMDWTVNLAMIALILRAFAGGCTAMTGIEAVANAGQMLAKPRGIVAKHILIALGITLSLMFLGITLTTTRLAIHPLENESVLSQITTTLWGDGLINQFVQILTAIILFLAANTSFVGFPNLTAMLAKDSWLPKQLSALGDRLVFSKGIVALSIAAIVLVVSFKGDPHALIPLYAIGVFTAFTLSQAGMVRYWLSNPNAYCDVHYKKTLSENEAAQAAAHESSTLYRLKCFLNNNLRPLHRFLNSHQLKATINGLGATMTMMALVITFEAKFFEGAFLVLIIIPLIVMFSIWVRKQYFQADANLVVDDIFIKTHPRLKMFSNADENTVIVPISRLHRGSFEALAFAREMSKDVKAVIVDIDHERSQKTYKDLVNLNWGLEIVVLASPYRSVIKPIIDFVHQADEAKNELSVLILPELVPAHWWQNFLHNKTAKGITRVLAWSEKIPDKARIIINVPYYLRS